MYTVEIRESIMIAHSLKGDVFGPAQRMHGATYIVDAVFISETLDPNNIVIDIGAAHTKLKEVLEPLNFQNLDEMPEFRGEITTTEFLAKYIHDRLKESTASLFSGKIRIVLHESHVARASYSGDV